MEHKKEYYTSDNGVMTKTSEEVIQIDTTQIIADKEAQLLEIYEEIQKLKEE